MNMTMRKKALGDLGKLMGRSDLGAGLSRIIAGQQVKSGSMKMDPTDDLIHLLSRTSFGLTQAELAAAEAVGQDAWLQQQLDHESIDDSELEGLLTTAFPSLNMTYNEIFEALNSDDNFRPAIDLIVATILRQIASPKQLFEVMTEFWTNHFNVFIFDGPVEYFKSVDDRVNIRPHVLGTFSDMLHANARSPAMLFYLDNYSNTVQGPNENYARELMELHTLGVNGGYNEADVAEVSRCFTGWTIDDRNGDFFGFFSITHDFEEKTVLGNTIPAGQGIEDGEQVLDILAAHPSTASFIASKLCVRFISDTPDQAIVDTVAQTFSDTDGDIRATMETLLTSDAFRNSQGIKFKRPAEYLTSAIRSTNASIDAQGRYLQLFFDQLDNLGQLPYFSNPPTGYPDFEAAWLNTGSLLSRWNFSFGLGYGDVELPSRRDFGDNELVYSDAVNIPVLDLIGEARTPAQITDTLIDRILHRKIGSDERKAMIEYVADGQPSTVPMSLTDSVLRGRAALAAILSSRYFQFR